MAWNEISAVVMVTLFFSSSTVLGGVYTPVCSSSSCPTATWLDASAGEVTNFTLKGSVKSTVSNYITFAFATAQLMGSSLLVVDCYDVNGTAMMGTSRNSLTHTNYVTPADAPSVFNRAATRDQGILTCSFSMALPDSSAYVLISEGPMNLRVTPTVKTRHANRYASATPYDFTSVTTPSSLASTTAPNAIAATTPSSFDSTTAPNTIAATRPSSLASTTAPSVTSVTTQPKVIIATTALNDDIMSATSTNSASPTVSIAAATSNFMSTALRNSIAAATSNNMATTAFYINNGTATPDSFTAVPTFTMSSNISGAASKNVAVATGSGCDLIALVCIISGLGNLI